MIENFKKFFSKNLDENGKKKLETLVVFVIILIITIISINVIWNGEKKPKDNSDIYAL